MLAHINSHMREELANLPNYTCLETIARFHAEPRGRLEPLDTVRLEILYSDRREWYGLPGDKSLSAEDPGRLTGTGMIGTGAFAIVLSNILAGLATITSRGEEAVEGRPAVKYDYHLSRFLSRFEISVPGGRGIVGEEGSFWADPHSLDFIRLEAHASEIPTDLPLREASVNVQYARTRIGERNVLVPQQAELHMVRSKGEETFDRLAFTHCRAFSAESALSVDSDAERSAEASRPNTPSAPSAPADTSQIASGLVITVELTTPITERDAVGTPLRGRVIGDVRRKGKVVIPNGSVVRGRIRQLERDSPKGSSAFRVALEFTDLEASRGRRLSTPTFCEWILAREFSGLFPIGFLCPAAGTVDARTETGRSLWQRWRACLHSLWATRHFPSPAAFRWSGGRAELPVTRQPPGRFPFRAPEISILADNARHEVSASLASSSESSGRTSILVGRLQVTRKLWKE